MRNSLLLTALLLALVAEARRAPKVVALSSTSTVAAADIRKGFQEKCPNVSTTHDARKADYALEVIAGTENPVRGVFVPYRFTLFSRTGDTIYSGYTATFSEGVNNVCMTINGGKPKAPKVK